MIPDNITEIIKNLKPTEFTNYPLYQIRKRSSDLETYEVLSTHLTYNAALSYWRANLVTDTTMYIYVTSLDTSQEFITLIDWLKSLIKEGMQ